METHAKKNEIFVKYLSLYFHNTDCNAVRLNLTFNKLIKKLYCSNIKPDGRVVKYAVEGPEAERTKLLPFLSIHGDLIFHFDCRCLRSI